MWSARSRHFYSRSRQCSLRFFFYCHFSVLVSFNTTLKDQSRDTIASCKSGTDYRHGRFFLVAKSSCATSFLLVRPYASSSKKNRQRAKGNSHRGRPTTLRQTTCERFATCRSRLLLSSSLFWRSPMSKETRRRQPMV